MQKAWAWSFLIGGVTSVVVTKLNVMIQKNGCEQHAKKMRIFVTSLSIQSKVSVTSNAFFCILLKHLWQQENSLCYFLDKYQNVNLVSMGCTANKNECETQIERGICHSCNTSNCNYYLPTGKKSKADFYFFWWWIRVLKKPLFDVDSSNIAGIRVMLPK